MTHIAAACHLLAALILGPRCGACGQRTNNQYAHDDTEHAGDM